MHQQRLFVLAVEAIALRATYVAGEGWSLSVASRRQGDPWDEHAWTHYSRLSTQEMLQVIVDDLGSRL